MIKTVKRIAFTSRTISKARELGVEMANADPIIRPWLAQACRYDDYQRFRLAHRARWEQTDQFERRWQDRIFKLSERESPSDSHSNCDSIDQWQNWYHLIVCPIKNLMWDAWESAVHLQKLYEDARAKTVANSTGGFTETLRIAHTISEGVDSDQIPHELPRVADPVPVFPASELVSRSETSEPTLTPSSIFGAMTMGGPSVQA